ncbi:16S rRNA (uracil(1498)-N(3))-methyltransferase [Thermomonospora catenispora]|mgnify:CR=1 FL=1|uniref:16S rRNA (uracil(1498)-N(3))-methyltransferase n=1 Tax=Thermomonospora catenispora TaxID=2493090 RepID=UPI0011206701|nr:16S rRNA (uracil(1498)-N(3))-methyltransferase [Thermomonospora catenispora]TNY35042.1 16S rRNA (uracil(1498)-N(3))-methyltransferase [Thermomonospora catenispora]
MSAPVFLTETARLAADRVVLDGPEGRHAVTVRRLRPGERVDLTDGAGLLAEGVVAAVEGKDRLVVEVRARHRHDPPSPRLTVVQALPKGDRGELAVETMTEVGVDEIVPWQAARCITRWRPDRRDKALGRWRSTAREAAKQSRRSRLPRIADLADTAQVAARLAAADRALVLHEEATLPLRAVDLPDAGDIVVVVGPEGGITDEELERFADSGAVSVRLGPTVLRTSTAGVAAAAVLLSSVGRW